MYLVIFFFILKTESLTWRQRVSQIILFQYFSQGGGHWQCAPPADSAPGDRRGLLCPLPWGIFGASWLDLFGAKVNVWVSVIKTPLWWYDCLTRAFEKNCIKGCWRHKQAPVRRIDTMSFLQLTLLTGEYTSNKPLEPRSLHLLFINNLLFLVF